MGRYVAPQQIAVQPAQVPNQLIKVVAAAIDAKIDARMAQLRMVVDQQGLLLMA